MSNIETTTNKTRGIVLIEPVFKNELVTFAAAGTLKAGTILARDTSTLKMVPFVKGGTTDGNGVPGAVLTTELVATAAGDLTARPLIGGQVRAGDLVIAADGDATNVDAAVLDGLRDYGITGLATIQLAQLDNQ